MDTRWKEYAALDARERAAEAELREVRAIKEELEPALLDDMAESGLDRVTINGVTFYPARRFFVGPDEGLDKTTVAAALKEAGLGDYVKNDYNTNSLTSYVRSLAVEAGGVDTMSPEEVRALLPEPLRACLKVGEIWRMGSRKA